MENFENKKGRLKTAIEIAMEKTDNLVEKKNDDVNTVENPVEEKGNLKTAVEIAMEKTAHLVEKKSEQTTESNTESDTEKPPEIPQEIAPEVNPNSPEDTTRILDVAAAIEKENLEQKKQTVEIGSETMFVLKMNTIEKVKFILGTKINNFLLRNLSSRYESYKKDVVNLTEEIAVLKKRLETDNDRYENAKNGITDKDILETFEKSRHERIFNLTETIQQKEIQLDYAQYESDQLEEKIESKKKQIEENKLEYSAKIDKRIELLRISSRYQNHIEIRDIILEKISVINGLMDTSSKLFWELNTALNNGDLVSKKDKKAWEKKAKKQDEDMKRNSYNLIVWQGYLKTTEQNIKKIENQIAKWEQLKPVTSVKNKSEEVVVENNKSVEVENTNTVENDFVVENNEPYSEAVESSVDENEESESNPGNSEIPDQHERDMRTAMNMEIMEEKRLKRLKLAENMMGDMAKFMEDDSEKTPKIVADYLMKKLIPFMIEVDAEGSESLSEAFEMVKQLLNILQTEEIDEPKEKIATRDRVVRQQLMNIAFNINSYVKYLKS